MTAAHKPCFGTIQLQDGFWHIACEPHIRLLFRRLFPAVSQRPGEVILLSNTISNSRDLLWFTERYPMRVEQLAHLQAQASRHVESENLVDALLSERRPPEHIELVEPARPYQLVAASLLAIKGGLLLADRVGLGKTVSAICSMANPENLPALVVCEPHLVSQWVAFCKRFLGQHINVHVIKSTKMYPLVPTGDAAAQGALFDAPRLPDVIVCTYRRLDGWADVLAGVIRYVVIDECQELRHPDTNKYAAVKMVAAKAKLTLGLSGTPIHNYGIEYFHVMDILMPGALGTLEEFRREWCDLDRLRDPLAFGEYLRREGMMLRRSRQDVGQQLPPVQQLIEHIDADEHVLNRVKGSAVELAQKILAAQQNYRGEHFASAGQFDMLMRQATGIAKAPYAAQFVRMLVESGERVVVYAWHREVWSILMEQLADFNPRLYTGTESPRQKEENKRAFIEGDCQVLGVSLRSGKGLDGLQHACCTCVFAELDWSGSVMLQCVGRLDRDGQLNPVMAYILLSESGADPIMADIIGIKRGQLEGVIDPEAVDVEQLEIDPDHIKKLAESYLASIGVKADKPVPVVEKD